MQILPIWMLSPTKCVRGTVQAYNLAYEPIKVRLGDLTDPNYVSVNLPPVRGTH